MWKKTTVSPDVGKHAETYARLAEADRAGRPPRRLTVFKEDAITLPLALTGVVADLAAEMAVSRNAGRSVILLARVIHEAAVLLARIGLNADQVNMILASEFDDEMCCVDPERGFLDDNGGLPYKFDNTVVDPPEFEPYWVSGVSRKLRDLRIINDENVDEGGS